MPGVAPYVRREPDPVVVRWWQALPEGTAGRAAALRRRQVLPRGAARALHEIGVVSPEVVVDRGRSPVRRGIASRDVVSTVLLARLNHSERRLV